MPKVTLDRTFVYAGQFYGPGETDVPDALHKNLIERGFVEAPKPAKPASTPDPLAAFEQLKGTPYATAKAAKVATDEQLLVVLGGDADVLKQIREALT